MFLIEPSNTITRPTPPIAASQPTEVDLASIRNNAAVEHAHDDWNDDVVTMSDDNDDINSSSGIIIYVSALFTPRPL